MKKQITIICLLVISLFATSIYTKAQTADKEDFIYFWVKFKNALKNNDADFLFAHTEIPFQSEGGYYNTEAYLEDIKDYHKEVYPPYLHEMDFVRFDIVMVEYRNACVWIGYDELEDAYFYCYKILKPGGNLDSSTYEERYYFKKFDGTFKFYRMTAGMSGIEY